MSRIQNVRETQFENWMEQNNYSLEDEFINSLPLDEQPKTDDPDEAEDILMSNEEEYLKFCWDKYDEAFSNDNRNL